MKKIIYLTITFLSFSFFVYSSYANDFIEGFEDIPLIDGFKQSDNQYFSFGNEESGLSESVIVSKNNKSFNDLKSFYIEVLPKLGWNLKHSDISLLTFIRDGNLLEFHKEKSKPLTVSITLKSIN